MPVKGNKLLNSKETKAILIISAYFSSNEYSGYSKYYYASK